MKIKATSPKTGRELTVEYEVPETHAGMLELWGEAGIHSLAQRQAATDVKNFCRARLDKTDDNYMTDEAIIEALTGYNAGLPTKAKDPKSKAQTLMGKLSPEVRAALLAALQDQEEDENSDDSDDNE